jgi:hypothetical protein
MYGAYVYDIIIIIIIIIMVHHNHWSTKGVWRLGSAHPTPRH